MPEFPVRVSWTSDANRIYWEPKLHRITEAWKEVELQRKNSLHIVNEKELALLAQKCKNTGKIIFPLKREGVSEGYGNSTEYQEGKPYRYRVAVTNREDLKFWQQELSDREVGRLLDYPECCISFFEKYWVGEKFLDLTWLQALNSVNQHNGRTVNLSCIPSNNVMLRWLGIRLISHMPCSFNCKGTDRIGYDNFLKFPNEENKWIDELLQLPIKWSALHGIAEVKTSLFRFIARTDATGEEYVVEVNGEIKKEEPVIDTWSDNGFASKELMDEAHRKLLRVADINAIREKHILDLGCGNGELLSRLPEGIHKYGIDIDPAKIEKCAQRLHNHNTFKAGRITDFQWDVRDYNAIFISVNRINECTFEERRALLDRLYSRTKKLILYSYDYKNWDTPRGFDFWPYKGFQIDGVRVFERND